MKALHKGSLFSKWSSPGWKGREGALKNDVMKVGGAGEGQVAQPQAGRVVLFTFTWLCSSQLDFTEQHLPHHRSQTFYGLAFLFGDSVGLPLGGALQGG